MQHPQLAQAQAEAGRGWTPTRVLVATSLYNERGYSAAQVACLIGGVTRNAVIGKINRDGLSDAERKASRAAGQARDERRRSAAGASGARGRTVKVAKPATVNQPKTAPTRIVDAQIPVEQRRTLDQLDNACCHWPVGDPRDADFFFCGAPKANDEGIPYCPSHLVRSQNPDNRRRKPKGAAFVNAGPGAAWRGR